MNTLKYVDYIFQISGNIVAPPLVGILLGQLLDSHFKTKPVFLLILLFLGIAVGIRSLFRLVKSITEK